MTPPTTQTGMEERYRKKFNYASFTWNGDNANGIRFAKQTNRKMLAFIRSEITKAVEADRAKVVTRLKAINSEMVSKNVLVHKGLIEFYIKELTTLTKEEK